MKYIEELSIGDTFSINNTVFVLTSDFKNNGDRYCICLSDGSPRWFNSQEIVEISPIYLLDDNNTIIPIKHTKKDE